MAETYFGIEMKKGVLFQLIVRLIGTLFVLVCLWLIAADVIDEIIHKPEFDIKSVWDGLMITSAAFFIVGIAGLIIALWYEGTGAIIAFFGMAIFIVLLMINVKVTFNHVLFLFLIPSLLYIIHWKIAGKLSDNNNHKS
jgi:hypothetical protein